MVLSDTMKVPAHVWKSGFAEVIQADHTAELPRIAAPTLLIWGDRDSIVGRSRQDELMAGITGAERIVYRGVGHSPHWEEPARFAADLADFILRIG
jgi:pimeloyl-ACP methyl ester carboxylesterase